MNWKSINIKKSSVLKIKFFFKLRNKDVIKSVVFEIEYENGIKAHLKTIDTNENVINRVELNFSSKFYFVFI